MPRLPGPAATNHSSRIMRRWARKDQLLATIRYIHEQHPGLPVILDSKRG